MDDGGGGGDWICNRCCTPLCYFEMDMILFFNFIKKVCTDGDYTERDRVQE